MVWDAARNRVVMFGGYEWVRDMHFRDQWEFDGANWSQRALGVTPPARQIAGMCYDERRGVIVLFGGTVAPSFASPRYLNDTWEFDGNTWRQVVPGGSLPAPRFCELTYDSARGVVVLFGGSGDTAPYSYRDTWEFDGVAWTEKTPSASPPARNHYTAAFDARRARVVVHPGYIMGESTQMDTWEWDGSQWTQCTNATTPPPFSRPAMSYDSRRQVVVLVGATSVAAQETWEFDGADWRAVATTASNIDIGRHALAYDARRGAIVMFGGNELRGRFIVDSDETWQFASFATYQPFGSGCAISGPAPSLAARADSLPRTGSTLVVELGNLSLTTTPFLLIGLDKTAWGGGSLPFDLGLIGLPGCQLLTSSEIGLPLTNQVGTAQWSLAIPLDARLHGATFHNQGFVLDAAMRPLGVSNGGTATIGR